jgi:hypothetical protein
MKRRLQNVQVNVDIDLEEILSDVDKDDLAGILDRLDIRGRSHTIPDLAVAAMGRWVEKLKRKGEHEIAYEIQSFIYEHAPMRRAGRAA